jgi:DNA-binding MarR family transcriptional regulator
MTAPALKRELVRLRILQFLSDPVRAEYGATLDGIKHGIERIRTIHDEGVLAEMVREGLVERRPDAHNARAKPYFVTDHGRAYLERQRDKERPPEPDPDRRPETMPGADLGSLIADYIRRLPEFRDSGEERVSEVSRELTCALGRLLGRSPGPHR